MTRDSITYRACAVRLFERKRSTRSTPHEPSTYSWQTWGSKLTEIILVSSLRVSSCWHKLKLQASFTPLTHSLYVLLSNLSTRLTHVLS